MNETAEAGAVETLDTGTWHYGLIARSWAEFSVAEPHEIAWYRSAIERFGQPVPDVGCRTGRLLLPLLEAGVDIDGLRTYPFCRQDRTPSVTWPPRERIWFAIPWMSAVQPRRW